MRVRRGSLGKALLGQNPLDGTDREFNTVLGQQLDDFPRGEPSRSPLPDLVPNCRVDLTASGLALGNRFGKIDLAVDELVLEQAEIPGPVPEAIRNDMPRESLDEESAQGFVSSLPVEPRIGKKRCVFHVNCYTI